MRSKFYYLCYILSIILILVIISIIISHILSILYYNNSNITHIPIIIFKLPRSGSTWLTERLNSIPNVYISKEIIQRSDVLLYNSKEQENFLIDALNKPKGKISDKDKIIPSNRYFQDYYFHNTFKLFRKMEVLGFTLNPEHSQNINWKDIYDNNNKVRIIVLRRGNIIKTALSGYRGKENKIKCGQSNIRSNSNNCILTQLNLTNYEFVQEIKKWQERFDNFDNFINNIPFQKTILYYEQLQQNFNSHIHRVFNEIGIGKVITDKKIESKSVWMKRNPDDLRQIILNYDSIRNSLIKGNCSCLLKHLDSYETELFYDRCKEKILTEGNNIICM